MEKRKTIIDLVKEQQHMHDLIVWQMEWMQEGIKSTWVCIPERPLKYKIPWCQKVIDAENKVYQYWSEKGVIHYLFVYQLILDNNEK